MASFLQKVFNTLSVTNTIEGEQRQRERVYLLQNLKTSSKRVLSNSSVGKNAGRIKSSDPFAEALCNDILACVSHGMRPKVKGGIWALANKCCKRILSRPKQVHNVSTAMTAEEALNVCNLAPLSSRRDIALLGLIHRTVLGGGPGHFRTFFRLRGGQSTVTRGRHRLQLEEYTCGHWTDFVYSNSKPADYIERSMLGLVSVYNRLPVEVVESASSVSLFQSSLQGFLKHVANTGMASWSQVFSPRVPWHRHLLSKFSCAT